MFSINRKHVFESRPGKNGSAGSEAIVKLGGIFKGVRGPVGKAARFISEYVVMPPQLCLVLGAWTTAAWLIEEFDRFPHLAISSPDKRCGKTLLLRLLATVVPRPRPTVNISPAALYRVVEQERPTLIMDESQSISRRGSEASEVIREILNAGIDCDARVTRCGGKNMDQIQEFSIYSPKVFAMIGEPDGVLADRCLPVPMKRKTADDKVSRFLSRSVEPAGHEIRDEVEAWAEKHRKEARKLYDRIEPFDIDNDRMAEMLLPLQVVVALCGGGPMLEELKAYAQGLDERDRQQEMQSPGIRLLSSIREVFWERKNTFLPTATLLANLIGRTEEPWFRWSKGEPLTPEGLANLLRPFGIRSNRDKTQRLGRGYFADSFTEAWDRYLPLSKKPPNPPNATNPRGTKGVKT